MSREIIGELGNKGGAFAGDFNTQEKGKRRVALCGWRPSID
jgi:hypothetical protein